MTRYVRNLGRAIALLPLTPMLLTVSVINLESADDQKTSFYEYHEISYNGLYQSPLGRDANCPLPWQAKCKKRAPT